MPAEEVVGQRAGALVGDDGDVEPGHAAEQLCGEIVLGARRRRAGIEPAGCLGERDQLGDGLRRKGRVRHHHDGGRGDEADRPEIPRHVVARLGIEAGVDRRGPACRHRQGVAVGRRPRRGPRADHAGGAAAVLDDDLLAERRRKPFGGDAADRIDAAAGRERHDHGDRPDRVFLRGGVAHAGQPDRPRTSRRRWRVPASPGYCRLSCMAP